MKHTPSEAHRTVTGFEVVMFAAAGGALGAFLSMHQALGFSALTLGVSGLSAIGVGLFAAIGLVLSRKSPNQ